MRWGCCSVRSVLSGFVLGLLIATGVAAAQITAAQEPAFDVDQPVESLRRAATPQASDSDLIALATALQEARADTEISYDEYKDGVWFFQQHYPGFYGSFFGDPSYATYDVRYQRLTWRRQLAEPDINPVNSFRNADWFFCHPLGYDPAFNGRCRGFEFAASDFLFLPAGPAFAATGRDRVRTLAARIDADLRTQSVDPPRRELDTSRTPVANAPTPDRPESGRSTSDAVEAVTIDKDLSSARVMQIRPSDHPTREFEVPDRVRTLMQETASSFRQRETILRIRQEIERRDGRNELSAEERARVAQRAAEERRIDELTRPLPQIRGTRANWADHRLSERQDRNERERRRRTVDRPADSGFPESVQHRPAELESSEPSRNRSRAPENPSDDRQ